MMGTTGRSTESSRFAEEPAVARVDLLPGAVLKPAPQGKGQRMGVAASP